MKIKFIRSYKKRETGNTVFVYAVQGTPAQLEAFANAQGDKNVIDEKTGESLWFTTRFVGNSGDLIITSNGKVVADMSKFDQAASLAAQYGGNLGDQLARAAAESLLGHNAVSAPVEKTPASQGDISKL